MRKKRSSFKEIAKVYGLGLAVFALACLAAYRFVEPAPPRKVTIATASKEGRYFAFAQEYKKHFAQENIELQILETSGSVENLRLLKEGKVEVAFLQGGVGQEEAFPHFQGLASLYLEPLFIFTRLDQDIVTIRDLAGKRLGIGPEGSGTRKIAMQLLADNSLEDGSALLLSSSGKEGVQQLLKGEIDALFMVTGLGSETLTRLLADSRITLLNLQRAEAYSRLHRYLSHVVLPQGILDMKRDIPRNDIHMVAPAATLVANDLLHPALIDLFMQIADKAHGGGTLLAPPESFPSAQKVDFPLSKEALRYFKHGPPFLQRYMPFWAASLIDRLKFMVLPLVALLIPLIKVLPPVYRWRIRSRIYRWYDELLELDGNVRENTGDDAVKNVLAALDTMENDVRVVEVPLSYAEELYHLRLHIDLLRKQLMRHER